MYSITYIYHDCFMVRAERCVLLFDYWLDKVPSPGPLPRFFDSVPEGMPIYVFVSHHHKDHFNRHIYEWQKYRPNITYIVSRDVMRSSRSFVSPESIYTGFKPDPESVIALKEGEMLTRGEIEVHAFGSTDTGNSWAVAASGLKIFHAGDLNAWIWRDESTQQEIEEALLAYRRILDSIAAYTAGFDVAMFPVDKRIGTGYYEGAAEFVRRFDIGLFLPMHFCLGEDERQSEEFVRAASDFSLYANRQRGRYAALTTPYTSCCDFSAE